LSGGLILLQAFSAVYDDRLNGNVTVPATGSGFDCGDCINYLQAFDHFPEYRIPPALGSFTFEI
jgi:hypothetical protein